MNDYAGLVESLLIAFERLALSLAPSLGAEILRLQQGDEPFRGVRLVSEYGAADLSLWAREHVGGMVDVEVIDGNSVQRLWLHLEGPSVAELEAAWAEMVTAYVQLSKRTSGQAPG